MKSTAEKVKARLETLKSHTHPPATPRVYGQKYFYVFGFTPIEGKKVLWGPFMSAHEADSYLAGLDDGEVFEYDTRDLARASRLLKAELMKRGENPDDALRRLLHKR